MNPSLSSAHVLSSTPPPAQVLMSYGYGTVVPCSSVLFSFSYCVLQMSLEVLLAQATLPLLELVSLPLLELVVSLEAPHGSSLVTNEQVGDDVAGATLLVQETSVPPGAGSPPVSAALLEMLPLLDLVSLLQPQAGSPQVTNEEVQARLPLLELVVSLEAPCGSSPVTNEQVGDDAAGAAGTASYSVVVVLRTAAVLQSAQRITCVFSCLPMGHLDIVPVMTPLMLQVVPAMTMPGS